MANPSGTRVPKNIVLLSDGTGNSSSKLLKTNVFRLYESLQLDNPRRQVACYDDGVGSGGFKPLKILGGAFGYGLKQRSSALSLFVRALRARRPHLPVRVQPGCLYRSRACRPDL